MSKKETDLEFFKGLLKSLNVSYTLKRGENYIVVRILHNDEEVFTYYDLKGNKLDNDEVATL